MKTEKEREIDDLFKQGLENPDNHNGYMDGDWGAMEQMLDERKRRPVIIYWLPILGSVAAVLLLVIGWWLLKPVAIPRQQAQQMAVNKLKPKQEIKAGEQRAVKHKNTIPPGIAAQPNAPLLASVNVNKPNVVSGTKVVKHAHANTHVQSPVFTASNIAGPQKSQANGHSNINTRQGDIQLVAYNPVMVDDQHAIIDQTIDPANISATLAASPAKASALSPNKIKNRASLAYKPQFAITVLAASDKNGVNSFQQTRPGNNAGVLFSVGLSPKFTISSGAIYTAKQYATGFANYHTPYQFPTNPLSVSADCKMFDVPINIDYRVFGNYRNKISIGTGVSSYLMLHESYQFNYAANWNNNGPTNFNVPSPDKYLLSIVNFEATYERQVNSKVGITIQPYMKLPLSTVGASQVRLQTTGVAVGLTWNLNSSSKP